MTREEIDKEIKQITRKINGLNSRLEDLTLELEILNCGLKVGDVVEIKVEVGIKEKRAYKFVPVEIKKFGINSLKDPDLYAKYNHQTKEGKDCDVWHMFYVNNASDKWRIPQKETDGDLEASLR